MWIVYPSASAKTQLTLRRNRRREQARDYGADPGGDPNGERVGFT